MQPNPDHIGAAEAAQILGIDRSTLSRMVRAGSVPVVLQMPGRTGARLFSRKAVMSVARERQQRAAVSA